MKKIVIILILFLVSFAARAQSVVAARMTNFTSKEVFGFLDATQTLQTTQEQQFSKLEMIFKSRVKVDRVTIEACDEIFHDGVDLYVNYSDDFKFLEGGKKTLIFEFKNQDVEALTLNFRRNVSFCLKKISLEFEGHLLPISAPKVFASKVEVSGGMKEYQNLFDSKLNTYITASSIEHPMVVNLSMDQAFAFDQVMVWPGNYTSDIIFKNFGRPREFKILCDRNAQESFQLTDFMRLQSFKTTKPQVCKNIKLEFSNSFEGTEVKFLAVSEIRFVNGEQTFVPDTSKFENQRKKELADGFEKANLSKLLERQLRSIENPIPSMVRLHADGSFFIHGFDELAKEHESFYILGEMTVSEVKRDRIVLHLKGIKKSNRLEMDSLSCGRKCLSGADFSNVKDYFEEDLLIRRGHDGFYRIDTVTPKKVRRIDFTSIRFLLDHTL